MRYLFNIIGLMMAVAFLTGCAADRDDSTVTVATDEPITMSLAFAVPEASMTRTRQADSVVQTVPAFYRGLQDVQIVPFIGDKPNASAVLNGGENGRIKGKPNATTEAAYYYYEKFTFPIGTNSVLFYGRGAYTVAVNDAPIPEKARPRYYGSTKAKFSAYWNKSVISFSPVRIFTEEEADAKAVALADYMTKIAKTEGWATSKDAKLEALYKNFMSLNSKGQYPVIAGSSANILSFVRNLYEEAGKYESDQTTAAAIRANIETEADITDGEVTALKSRLAGYPANIGLPDGTAAMQWDVTEGKFVQQIKPTSYEVAITSIDRFAYPAELYYFVESDVATSNNEVSKGVYENATDWSTLVKNHYKIEPVKDDTKAIAIKDPIHYGVAQLSVQLNKTKETLLDANEKEVNVADKTGTPLFPLTAIIIGGQYPVGYDFRPVGTEEDTEEDMLFVYDSEVRTNKKSDTHDYYYLNSKEDVGTTNTLVLQSFESEKDVTIVLEFENKSGQSFMGYDGVIYPDTKFYLMGKIKPANAQLIDKEQAQEIVEDLKKRVFTQGYVTKVEVNISSLKKAFNVMPDLLSPRLEIGVELVPEWYALQPTVLELMQ